MTVRLAGLAWPGLARETTCLPASLPGCVAVRRASLRRRLLRFLAVNCEASASASAHIDLLVDFYIKLSYLSYNYETTWRMGNATRHTHTHTLTPARAAARIAHLNLWHCAYDVGAGRQAGRQKKAKHTRLHLPSLSLLLFFTLCGHLLNLEIKVFPHLR